MKKILTAFAAMAVLATPVAAEARHRDNNRGDRVGNFIGGLVVGAIVGAVVSSSRDRRDPEPRYEDYREYDQPETYRARRVCFEEQIVEYRYGRKYVYYEYRCR